MDAQQSLGLEDPFMLADQALDDLLLGFAGSPGMACGDYGGIALHEHACSQSIPYWQRTRVVASSG